MLLTLDAERYVNALQNLSEDNLSQFLTLLDEDVHFKDPFNEGQGTDYFHHAMIDMYEKLDDVRFDVFEQCYADGTLVMHWVYSAKQKTLGEFSFKGVSWVKFNDEGKVTHHSDYWDSAELMQRVPLLGAAVRYFKRQAAI